MEPAPAAQADQGAQKDEPQTALPEPERQEERRDLGARSEEQWQSQSLLSRIVVDEAPQAPQTVSSEPEPKEDRCDLGARSEEQRQPQSLLSPPLPLPQ